MVKKILFSLSLTLALTAMLMPGCTTTSPELTAIGIVPQGISLLADIQVDRIINDPDFRDAYDRVEKGPDQPQTYEDALNQVTAEVGIDLNDITRVVFFMDVATFEGMGYTGMIAEGTFNETELISQMQAETGEVFTTVNYKDYRLYLDELEDSAITFLSDSLLVIGTVKAVKDVIDVSQGVREPVGGNILDIFNNLGSSLVKAAFEIPEETRRALVEEAVPGEVPISMAAFADVNIVGFALDKLTDTIIIQIDSHFLSTDSAEDAEEMISGMLSLFRGTMQVPEVKGVLEKIDVSLSGSSLTITLRATLTEIEQFIEYVMSDFMSDFELPDDGFNFPDEFE